MTTPLVASLFDADVCASFDVSSNKGKNSRGGDDEGDGREAATAAPFLRVVSKTCKMRSSRIQVQHIPGKGRGVVAIDDIPAGTVLLRETPLAQFASPLNKEFKRAGDPNLILANAVLMRDDWEQCLMGVLQGCCPATMEHPIFEDRKDILSQDVERMIKSSGLAVQLEGTRGSDAETAKDELIELQADASRFLAALHLNAMELKSDTHTGYRYFGFFPATAMFNHACCPNATHYVDPNATSPHTGDVIVRSVRDISKGEEICIAYIELMTPYEDRCEILDALYYFSCTCARCISYTKDCRDDRQVHAFQRLFPAVVAKERPLKDCEACIAFTQNIYPDAWPTLVTLYRYASLAATASRDDERSEYYTQLFSSTRKVCRGWRCGACNAFLLVANKCARCQRVAYCNAACQKKHWKAGHKQECATLSASSMGGPTKAIAVDRVSAEQKGTKSVTTPQRPRHSEQQLEAMLSNLEKK